MQDVVIGKHCFTTKRVLTIARRSSVLGLLLFLKYKNDLKKSIKHSQTYHFAGDTVITLKTFFDGRKLTKSL